MANKEILRASDVREKVALAVDKVSMPVIETIGPLGKNVLYENEQGGFQITNDGVTIAKAIDLKDPIENAVAELIKDGAKSTNNIAGDGTSTTILYTREAILKMQELRSRGMSHRKVVETFNKVADKLIKRLTKLKKEVKDDKTLKEIATISANNDKEIAKDVVEIIKTADLDGMIYIELNTNEETVIEKEIGYRISPGMQYQNLYGDSTHPFQTYTDIPVIIFDKQLYYADEAEHIIRTATGAGFKSIAIIAKDFLGDATNTFITNHARGLIQIVLAKLDDDSTRSDLAVYLGASVVSESAGRRVDSVVSSDWTIASKLTADPTKILLSNKSDNKPLRDRIKWLKLELDKNKDDKKIKTRLASLTSGIVTVKVGGQTLQEARERIFRFEDAINATRAAKRDGYLIGGGLSIFDAFRVEDFDDETEAEVGFTLAEASIQRIAKNAQIRLDWKKINPSKNVGLNALTGTYEDLLKAGVIEPFKVTEMAIRNAVSVASTITSIGTFVLNEIEDEQKRDNK